MLHLPREHSQAPRLRKRQQDATGLGLSTESCEDRVPEGPERLALGLGQCRDMGRAGVLWWARLPGWLWGWLPLNALVPGMVGCNVTTCDWTETIITSMGLELPHSLVRG